MAGNYMTFITEDIFMHIKENATGIQHIGIPTKDMDATIRFYESLGFERLYETRNKEEDDGRVIFFQLHDLVLETYEVKDPKMVLGAIDHFSINVKDIDDAFHFINEAGMNNTNDFIHFLPFFENGVKFFKIEVPNKETVEFNQYV